MKNNADIPYIILGSSRSEGDTKKVIDLVVKNQPHRFMDLNKCSIAYYDYKNNNQNDDFIPLIKEMLHYQKWVFATPVYWYTMSAIMKTFIDRTTDLLTIEKDLGRQLRGKEAYVISSDHGERTPAFEEVFQKTFEYLGIHYRGSLFYYSGNDEILSLENKNKMVHFSSILF